MKADPWRPMRIWPWRLARKTLAHYAKREAKKQILRATGDKVWPTAERLIGLEYMTFERALDHTLYRRILSGEDFRQLMVASGLTEDELYQVYPGVRL